VRETTHELPSKENILSIKALEQPEYGKCCFCEKEAVLYYQVEGFKGELGLACYDCGGTIKQKKSKTFILPYDYFLFGVILLFSKDDIELLSLEFTFPIEKEEILAERVLKEIPLGVLKFRPTELMPLIVDIIEDAPRLMYSDTDLGIDFSISKKELRLSLGRIRILPPIKKEEREKIIKKAFLDETLNKVSNDLTFIIGRLSSLMEERKQEIKASGNIKIRKNLEKEVFFDTNFKEEVVKSIKEISEVHFSGFEIKFLKKEGISQIDFSISEKEILVNVDFNFPYKKPINISELINDTINELNQYYQKIRVD